MKKLLVYLPIFILTLSLVYAVPGSWYGYVTLDDAVAADGAVVDAYISGSVVATSTVGAVQSNGYYLIHVVGNVGDTVSFKVNGNNITQGAKTWAAGFQHPAFNISANSTANGQACPAYSGYTSGTNVANLGCAGGFCVHDICRAASTYCGDGYCDTGESCASDCGGGGGSSGGGITTVCTESWDCTAWSQCSSAGAQTRSCADQNSCGTTSNKPKESQSCASAKVAEKPISSGEEAEQTTPITKVGESAQKPASEAKKLAKSKLQLIPLSTGIFVIISLAIIAIIVLFKFRKK